MFHDILIHQVTLDVPTEHSRRAKRGSRLVYAFNENPHDVALYNFMQLKTRNNGLDKVYCYFIILFILWT